MFQLRLTGVVPYTIQQRVQPERCYQTPQMAQESRPVLFLFIVLKDTPSVNKLKPTLLSATAIRALPHRKTTSAVLAAIVTDGYMSATPKVFDRFRNSFFFSPGAD